MIFNHYILVLLSVIACIIKIGYTNPTEELDSVAVERFALYDEGLFSTKSKNAEYTLQNHISIINSAFQEYILNKHSDMVFDGNDNEADELYESRVNALHMFSTEGVFDKFFNKKMDELNSSKDPNRFHNGNVLSLSWIIEIIKNINHIFAGIRSDTNADFLKDYFQDIFSNSLNDFEDFFLEEEDDRFKEISKLGINFLSKKAAKYDKDLEVFLQSAIKRLMKYLQERILLTLADEFENGFNIDIDFIAKEVVGNSDNYLKKYQHMLQEIKTVPIKSIFDLNYFDITGFYQDEPHPIDDDEYHRPVRKHGRRRNDLRQGIFSPRPSRLNSPGLLSTDDLSGDINDILSSDFDSVVSGLSNLALTNVIENDVLSNTDDHLSDSQFSFDFISDTASLNEFDILSDLSDGYASDFEDSIPELENGRPEKLSRVKKGKGEVEESNSRQKNYVDQNDIPVLRDVLYSIQKDSSGLRFHNHGRRVPLIKNPLFTLTFRLEVGSKETCDIVDNFIKNSSHIFQTVVRAALLDTFKIFYTDFNSIFSGIITNVLFPDRYEMINRRDGYDSDESSLYSDDVDQAKYFGATEDNALFFVLSSLERRSILLRDLIFNNMPSLIESIENKLVLSFSEKSWKIIINQGIFCRPSWKISDDISTDVD